MGKLRLMIAALILALSPLVWAATIGRSAQPIHTHDQRGKETTVYAKTMSVPVAEATYGDVRARAENTNTHVLLRVQVRVVAGGEVHAECWALDDGGVHHSHWIYACHLENNQGGQWTGGCTAQGGPPGGYGPCGYTTADQHWHTLPVGVLGNVCYRAVGGFGVSTHTSRTVTTPYWCD